MMTSVGASNYQQQQWMHSKAARDWHQSHQVHLNGTASLQKPESQSPHQPNLQHLHQQQQQQRYSHQSMEMHRADLQPMTSLLPDDWLTDLDLLTTDTFVDDLVAGVVADCNDLDGSRRGGGGATADAGHQLRAPSTASSYLDTSNMALGSMSSALLYLEHEQRCL